MLREELIESEDGPAEAWFPENKEYGHVRVMFDNLQEECCAFVQRYPVILGCVAWLTNEHILQAMADREVAIIVQKEDWLRPDT